MLFVNLSIKLYIYIYIYTNINICEKFPLYTAAATLRHTKTGFYLGHRAMLQASVGNHTALATAATWALHFTGYLDSGS